MFVCVLLIPGKILLTRYDVLMTSLRRVRVRGLDLAAYITEELLRRGDKYPLFWNEVTDTRWLLINNFPRQGGTLKNGNEYQSLGSPIQIL